MDDQFETKEIARSLSFEVEAIPQDNSIQLTSSTNNNNPLNVKIKVRKKKDLDSPQNAVLSIPRFTKRGSKPERIRLASSDQTIISFNVYMEEADEKKIIQKTKKKFFGLFKSGGAYDSDSSTLSKSENEIVSDNFTKIETLVNETKTSRKDRGKGIFGKSKPGGCLDPPFGEDKYAYEAVKNMQSTSVPYQIQELKLKEKDNLSIKKTILEDGTFDDKTSKTERSSVLSLFQADSFKPPVEISYSNSIITYPPPLTSSEMRVFNAVNEKNLKNKSSIDRSSFQDPTDRYFGPKRESSSRKSSKIEGIKEGDKDLLSASEQTKYLRTFDEKVLETKDFSIKDKEDYLKNKIIKDTMLPVAGGLIASTLLHSPSREKQDGLIATQNAQVTDLYENTLIGNKEIPKVKLELKDQTTNTFLKGSMLPVPGGLITSTQQELHSRDKISQDRIIKPENAQITDPNKDIANLNKEIPTVVREPPETKDHLTNEILIDSMLPVAGGFIAATLPLAFRKDKMIDPENAQVPDPNKDSAKENKDIPKVEQKPPEEKDYFKTEISKDSPIVGGLFTPTLPQAINKEKLKQDIIIDLEKSNKDSANRNKEIPKIEQERSEKKDHPTIKLMLPVAEGLIAPTLPQAFSKEKLKQDRIIDSENAQITDPNKDSANRTKEIPKIEQEAPEKKDHITNEILKSLILPVAGGLIVSTPPQALSKEKLKKDTSIDPEIAQIPDPNKDSANRNEEIPKVELEPPEKKDHMTNKNLKSSILPVAGGLIVSTPPQAFSKEKLKKDKIIDPEIAQIPDPNKDSANRNKEIQKVEQEPPEKKDHITSEILKSSVLPVPGDLIVSTLPQAFSKEKLQKDKIIEPEIAQIPDPNKESAKENKEISKVEQEPHEKKDHFTNEILKDSMLPVAGGLIAATLPQAFRKDKMIDAENAQVPDPTKDSAKGNKQIPKVEQEPPEKKDHFTNEILKDSMLPVAGGLIAATLTQAFIKEELKQDKIIDPENAQVLDAKKDSAKETKETTNIEQEPSEKRDNLTNQILKDSMIPVAEGLIASTLPQTFSKEKLKQVRMIDSENAQITDPNKDIAKNNENVPKYLTALPLLPPHGKEKLQKEIIDTENDQVPDTNEDRVNENNKIAKFEHESLEKIDYTKNDVLEDKIKPVAEGLNASSLLKSINIEKLNEENVIRPKNAYIGTNKGDATELDEIEKVGEKSPVKLSVDIQGQIKNDNIPSEQTTSSILTKLPVIMSTTTDELKDQHRKSLKEINNLLLVKNSIASNKESEEAILDPDPITRHEKSILTSVSTENEDDKSLKTGAPYLLEKYLTLKDDAFRRDEQPNINKTLVADEVDAKIYKGVEPTSRQVKNFNVDFEDNILKETEILVKEKDAHKEPILGSDLELDNVTEKIGSKKIIPVLKDEAKLPETIVIQEQHTKPDSGFEDLFPNKHILRTSPDEEADETIKDTPSVQAASKEHLKIVGEDNKSQNYIKLKEENQKGVAENKEQQYIADTQSQSKEKLIIPEQEKRIQSEPFADIQSNASDRSDALKELSLNEDLQNEISDRDIQKRAELEPKDESSYLFDRSSIVHKPVQFLSPEKKYVYAAPENSKKENIDNEINPEFIKQENKVIVLNIAFQSYVNEENKRVFRSVDNSKPLERFNDDQIFSFNSVVEPDGMEIRVPIDPENELSLNIMRKGNSASESKKIFKITPEFYTDSIKSKSKVPSKLTEEINRDNYEAKSDYVQYNLQKGLQSPESTFVQSLEKLEQRLGSKLVTEREKPVQQLESTLATDGQQTDHHWPEPKLVTSLQKTNQQPELTLTTDRVKQDHHPEFKIKTDHTKLEQQPESKFLISWKKQDHQPEIKFVTDRKKPDKQLFARREKLGIEPDSSIRATDMYSLRHSLSSVYQQHLVPLQDLIKSLKQEIDSLASQQELLRHNLLGVTKIKSTRVHATKKCMCQRKL